MKLREYIEANKGLTVKVGANDGFYFLYVGTIAEDTIEKLNKESDKLYKKYNKYFKNRLITIEILESRKELTEEEEQELDTSRRYIEKWKNYISSWKHLLDRDIVNKYSSIYREYDEIVIIEGREASSYIGIGKELRDCYE